MLTAYKNDKKGVKQSTLCYSLNHYTNNQICQKRKTKCHIGKVHEQKRKTIIQIQPQHSNTMVGCITLVINIGGLKSYGW